MAKKKAKKKTRQQRRAADREEKRAKVEQLKDHAAQNDVRVVNDKSAQTLTAKYNAVQRAQAEFDATVNVIADALEVPQGWVLCPRNVQGAGTVWEFRSQEAMKRQAQIDAAAAAETKAAESAEAAEELSKEGDDAE